MLRDKVVVAGLAGLLLGTLDGATRVIHIDGTTVQDNSVYGCLQTGVQLGGEVPMGAVRMIGNVIGSFGTGAVVGTDHTRLATNTIVGIAGDKGQVRFGVGLRSGGRSQLRDVTW